jgi:hypothetical protein
MEADDTKARENPTRDCEAGKGRVPGTRDSAYSRTRERGLISLLVSSSRNVRGQKHHADCSSVKVSRLHSYRL